LSPAAEEGSGDYFGNSWVGLRDDCSRSAVVRRDEGVDTEPSPQPALIVVFLVALAESQGIARALAAFESQLQDGKDSTGGRQYRMKVGTHLVGGLGNDLHKDVNSLLFQRCCHDFVGTRTQLLETSVASDLHGSSDLDLLLSSD